MASGHDVDGEGMLLVVVATVELNLACLWQARNAGAKKINIYKIISRLQRHTFIQGQHPQFTKLAILCTCSSVPGVSAGWCASGFQCVEPTCAASFATYNQTSVNLVGQRQARHNSLLLKLLSARTGRRKRNVQTPLPRQDCARVLHVTTTTALALPKTAVKINFDFWGLRMGLHARRQPISGAGEWNKSLQSCGVFKFVGHLSPIRKTDKKSVMESGPPPNVWITCWLATFDWSSHVCWGRLRLLF
jgi:hypothetical protein